MRDLDQRLFERIRKEKAKRNFIEEKGERGVEPNLLGISNALDIYYLINKIKIYCAYLSYRQIVDPGSIPYNDNDFQLIAACLAWVDLNAERHPILQVFQQIRHLYENIERANSEDDKRFDHLLLKVGACYQFQSVDENIELLSLLSNYSIYRLNRGASQYDYHFFYLNSEMLRLKYGPGQKKRSKLPASVFKNMVVTALRLEDQHFFSRFQTTDQKKTFADAFEWVEGFIEEYRFRLSKKDQENYYPYCKAMLEFRQKQYAKAYRTLKHPKYTREMFINLNIKVLYLQILLEIFLLKPIILETDEIEIEKVIESLRGMIRYESKKRKVLAYQLDYFRQFENLYRRLFRIVLGNPNDRLEVERIGLTKIQKRVEALSYGYKEWFLEKMAQIKK